MSYRKTQGWHLIVMAAVILCGLLMFSTDVRAADKPVRVTDVSTPAAGNEIVLIEGTFNYLAKETILNRINEIRREACEEGVPYPGNPSRAMTISDYVPMKWSSDLEQIAQTRAAEATVHWAHVRPNGKSCSSITVNGVNAGPENIAWNRDGNILDGIDQWYEEKADWVNQTEGKVTGHYTTLIWPSNRYVGIGAFNPTRQYGAIAGDFSTRTGLNEDQNGVQGEYYQEVEVQKSNLTITPQSPVSVRKGDTAKLTLKAMTSYENDLGGRWSPAKMDVLLTNQATWRSANSSIATVDSSGDVTGRAPGNTVITATYGGKDYTFNVEVTKPLTGISLKESEVCLHNSESAQMEIVPEPIDTKDELAATWKSGDESLATVDQNGKITAVSEGKTTVTATVGEFTATCRVTVSHYDLVSVENGLATVKCPNCGRTAAARVPTGFTPMWYNADPEASSYGSSQMPYGLEAGDAAYYVVRNYYTQYSVAEADADFTLAEFEMKADDTENCIVDNENNKVTFKKAGKYKITVWPTYNPDLKKEFSITIVKELESVELTAEQASQTPGSSVVLTATPEGGKGTLRYSFIQTDPEGKETILRENTTNAYWRTILDNPGDYSFRVEVTDPGDNNRKVTSNTAKAHIHDFQWVSTKDGIATLRCDGCGEEITEYVPISFTTFWRDAASESTMFSSYIPSGLEVGATLEYWPSRIGYANGQQKDRDKFTVVARDPEGCEIDTKEESITFFKDGTHTITIYPTYNPELKKSYEIKIVRKLEAVELTADPESSKYGEEVALTAVPDGGKGLLTYRFTATDASGTETEIREDASSATCQWTPAKAGQYQIKVYVTDAGDGDRQVSQTIDYTVAKLEHPPVMPAAEYSVPNKTDTLTDDILAEAPGWAFEESAVGTELIVGEAAEFTAVYTGEDAENYENLTATVKVTRSACDHENTELRNVKEATCLDTGWTGDRYCLDCGELIESGQEIPKTQNHTWDKGTVTKEPTLQEEGEITYTCTVCGQTRTETLAKLTGKSEDGTSFGPGAMEEIVEQAIADMKNDNDPPGTAFGLLQAKSAKQTNTSLTVNWKKVKGAESYVVYANKCGTTTKLQKQLETAANKVTLKKITGNDLKKLKVKKGTYYKVMIVAYDKDRKVVSTSKVIHVATKGGKVGNDKSVKTAAKKNKVTLKVKKTFKLKAKTIPASKSLKVKKHRVIQYESSKPGIATVSKKGVIKAKAKGTCYVYAYAQDGVMAKIKVTVK